MRLFSTHITSPGEAIPVPDAWREAFTGAAIERQAIGESRADVFLLRCRNGEELFLKAEAIGTSSELPDEVERLRWLKRNGLPGPDVLDADTEDSRHGLLMRAVSGQDLASARHLAPQQVIDILVMALRTLHRVPVETCPFDHCLEARIATARQRMNAGLVDETDFDDERQGLRPPEVFADLLASRPNTVDRVVTHGDACLSNFMADAGCFSGFIDCGRLGVSDRFQDLALAARSIERNFGREWAALFFRQYGMVHGIVVDHSTLHRWGIRLVPLLDKTFRRHKRPAE